MTTTTDDQALVPLPASWPADRRPALVYLADKAPRSRRVLRGDLDAIAGLVSGGQVDAATFPWHLLRFQHTQAIRARLAEQHAPATTNRMLSALRGTLRAAWRLGLSSAETYHRAADVRNVKGSRLPAGRAVTPGELAALLRACENDQTAAGARDAAIIALLYSCGLRRAELVALDVDDYDPEARTLRIQGKGDKERLAHVVDGAGRALGDWLHLRGDEPGPLFWPGRKGGRVYPGRMTPQAVYGLVKSRAARAGVKPLSPHDLRRSFVSDLLDAGADLSAVQALAGHRQVTTTTRYDRRPEAAKRKAAELLHVPYSGRTLPAPPTRGQQT